MNEQRRNIITTGPINQVILSIATPLMINNLIRTLYNLTDGLYVARLSAEDFAATAFIWPLNFLFISIGLGIGVGATSLIAQYLGAENIRKAKEYAENALLMVYVLGFLMASIGYLFAPQFIQWMGASGNFFDKSTAYLKINFIGLFFDFCYFGYQAILNAQGRTKTITRISAISSITNVVLDPFFIFGFVPIVNLPGMGWGIEGAAWATVISKVILYLLVISAMKRESAIQIPFTQFKLIKSTMQHIFKVALPSALGYGGSAFGFTVLNSLIQSYGTSTLAAYSMVNRITDLLTQPQMGIGGALTSIIGQNLGARQFDRAKAVFKRANLMIICISVIGSIACIVLRQPILSIFITDMSDKQLWRDAVEYLNYTAFIIFFMGLFSSYTGFFQGCGETKYSMYMSIGRLWVARLPIIWLLQYFTNLGSTGVWIAMLLSNAITVLYGYVVYTRTDWSKLEYAKS